MEVFGRVLPDRVVAAPDMTAGETQSQVNPLHPRFQTLFTPVGSTRSDVANGTKVAACAHTKNTNDDGNPGMPTPGSLRVSL